MAVTKQGRAIASQTISSNTTTAGQPFAVDAKTRNMIMICKISSRTDGTYVATIQHSHDGSNWETLKAGSNITSNDTVYLSYSNYLDGAHLGLVRIVIVSTSVTTGATAEASILFD